MSWLTRIAGFASSLLGTDNMDVLTSKDGFMGDNLEAIYERAHSHDPQDHDAWDIFASIDALPYQEPDQDGDLYTTTELVDLDTDNGDTTDIDMLSDHEQSASKFRSAVEDDESTCQDQNASEIAGCTRQEFEEVDVAACPAENELQTIDRSYGSSTSNNIVSSATPIKCHSHHERIDPATLPDLEKDISKQHKKYMQLHSRARLAQGRGTLGETRYAIAIYESDKSPFSVGAEKDFFWMLGHHRTVVGTVWRKYAERVMENDFVLLVGSHHPRMDVEMRELDFANDRLVVFRYVARPGPAGALPFTAGLAPKPVASRASTKKVENQIISIDDDDNPNPVKAACAPSVQPESIEVF